MKALYANVKEFGDSLEDYTFAVRDSFTRQIEGHTVGSIWVVDVFEDYVIARDAKGNHWRVNYRKLENGDFEFAAATEWQRVKPAYVPVEAVSEQTQEQQGKGRKRKLPAAADHAENVELVTVSEFRGTFPTVPAAPGVDLKALVEGDDDPMFLTVPVSRIGEVSKNGLVHDREFAESLVEQINRDRPGGLMGHLKEDERSTAFPTSSIHWIGAALVGDTVWAKGYIPRTKPEVREEYRIAKAKGGQVATSVYGRAVREFTDDGRKWRARDFVLETIDLAPYNRAALPGTRDFQITSEMQQGEQPMADKQQIIAELTVHDLPETLKAAVIKEFQVKAGLEAQIAELSGERDALKTRVAEIERERDALKARVAELEKAEQERIAEQERQQFDLALSAKIAELINWEGDERAQTSRDLLRSQFKRAVLAELNGDRSSEQVERVVAEVWQREFQALAETLRDALAGPPAIVSAKKPQFQIDDSPEAIAAARAKFGI